MRPFKKKINYLYMEGCPVCFEELNDDNSTTIGCNHILCIECVNKIVNDSTKCPICRANIKEYFNNNERSHIIIKSSNNNNNDVGDVIPLRAVKMLMYKYYSLWILLVSTIFWLASEKYYNILLNVEIKLLTSGNTNLTQELDECESQLSLENKLTPTYLYDPEDGSLIFCQIPEYFISKCTQFITSQFL
jgi:hypothetical protein